MTVHRSSHTTSNSYTRRTNLERKSHFVYIERSSARYTLPSAGRPATRLSDFVPTLRLFTPTLLAKSRRLKRERRSLTSTPVRRQEPDLTHYVDYDSSSGDELEDRTPSLLPAVALVEDQKLAPLDSPTVALSELAVRDSISPSRTLPPVKHTVWRTWTPPPEQERIPPIVAPLPNLAHIYPQVQFLERLATRPGTPHRVPPVTVDECLEDHAASPGPSTPPFATHHLQPQHLPPIPSARAIAGPSSTAPQTAPSRQSQYSAAASRSDNATSVVLSPSASRPRAYTQSQAYGCVPQSHHHPLRPSSAPGSSGVPPSSFYTATAAVPVSVFTPTGTARPIQTAYRSSQHQNEHSGQAHAFALQAPARFQPVGTRGPAATQDKPLAQLINLDLPSEPYVCRLMLESGRPCSMEVEFTRQGLRRHMERVHRADWSSKSSRARCEWQGCTSDGNMEFSDYFRHMLSHLNVARFECTSCGRRFTRKDVGKNHLKNKGGCVTDRTPVYGSTLRRKERFPPDSLSTAFNLKGPSAS